MSKVLSLPAHSATLDDDAWDDLLNFIEEGRVIPIIGPELLRVDTDSGPRLLYDWLAEKLAAKLGGDPAMLLAQITDFDLFISTTFDSLLEQALNSVKLWRTRIDAALKERRP